MSAFGVRGDILRTDRGIVPRPSMMGPTDLSEPMLQGQNKAQAEKIVLPSYSHRTGQPKFAFPRLMTMSALTPKADMIEHLSNICFVPKADMGPLGTLLPPASAGDDPPVPVVPVEAAARERWALAVVCPVDLHLTTGGAYHWPPRRGYPTRACWGCNPAGRWPPRSCTARRGSSLCLRPPSVRRRSWR